jgi:hypothetical protein
MKWFDPISERWIDPPAPITEPPLTHEQCNQAARLDMEETARRWSANRVWEAVVATAQASQMQQPAAPIDDYGFSNYLDTKLRVVVEDGQAVDWIEETAHWPGADQGCMS